MGWVRLDDTFYEHPKFAVAGTHAEHLWLRALAWCNHHLTDGYITSTAVERLAVDLCAIETELNNGHPVTATYLADQLVLAGCWRRRRGGGYIVHDYLSYQPSAADVDGKRIALHGKRREAGLKGAAARWGTTQQADDGKMANGIAPAKQPTSKRVAKR